MVIVSLVNYIIYNNWQNNYLLSIAISSNLNTFVAWYIKEIITISHLEFMMKIIPVNFYLKHTSKYSTSI